MFKIIISLTTSATLCSCGSATEHERECTDSLLFETRQETQNREILTFQNDSPTCSRFLANTGGEAVVTMKADIAAITIEIKIGDYLVDDHVPVVMLPMESTTPMIATMTRTPYVQPIPSHVALTIRLK